MSTWTTCIKIKRVDGETLGLTELDRSLNIAGVEYISAAGYSPSNFTTNSSMSVNHADVEGLLGYAGVSREEIRSGAYDFAEISLFIYDYELDRTVKLLAVGNWGETQLLDNGYKTEFRSLTQRMQQSVGNVYTSYCTAELGDARCKVNVTPLVRTGSVTGITSRLKIQDSTRTEVADYWKGGTVTFLTGNNKNRIFEVTSSLADGTLAFFLPLSFPAVIGDTYVIKPGCDKSLATCKDRYNNILNFRGFPHVPGIVEILRIGKEGYVNQ